MPAHKATSSTTHKGPAFKPPRLVKAAAGSASAAKRAVGASASRPSGAGKQTTTSRPNFEPDTLDSSSDSEQEDAVPSSEGAESMEDASRVEESALELQDGIPPIPEKLLARLLYEGFEDKEMKIQKGAMDLVSKYMDTFVREAITRAQFERRGANTGGGISAGFLQVEDLEKLAPQLVLDF